MGDSYELSNLQYLKTFKTVARIFKTYSYFKELNTEDNLFQGSKRTGANRNDITVREIMTNIVPVREMMVNIVPFCAIFKTHYRSFMHQLIVFSIGVQQDNDFTPIN